MENTLNALLPPALLQQLLSAALAKGGDFAEVFAQRSFGSSLSLEEDKVKLGAYGISLGVGIRVISGDEVGYAYSDDLETEALLSAASVAASIARTGHGKDPVNVTRIDLPNRYPISVLPDSVEPANKVALLKRGNSAARAHDHRVKQVMASFADSQKDILIANSEGLLVLDRQVMCRMNFSVIADDGKGDKRSGSWGGGGRVAFDFYDSFSPEDVAKEAARMATAQLGAIDAPAGPQTVVLSPGSSGVLLHEAVGHGLEADFIEKGTSLYAGQLGERVAAKGVTVIDSGELQSKRGSINTDDEGAIPKERVLIEDGILKDFLYDRISAKKMKQDYAGSGRRQSYKHAPLPRMSNTYLAPGDKSHEEILSSVKNGLYCASFGGGQVDISNGNYVFEVKEGYMIEDGKIGAPVKGATLVGVGPESLKNVTMVGNDPELDPGIYTCGKDGQSVPVGVGLPTLRMENITVGGTNVGS